MFTSSGTEDQWNLRRGKRVRRNPFKKGLTTSVFITMILTTTLITSLVPKVTAAPTTAITLIDPPSGSVGTEVRVNGTIDTANGTYILRWDERLDVTTGNATEFDVYASFIVPQTSGMPDLGRDVLIELIDNKTRSIANATFRLYTEYCIKAVVPLLPFQLQEGQETDIWVNVTGGVANTIYVANITVKDPANTTSWATVSLTNTTTTGYGDGKRRYPTDFSAGAHTNYTGTYHIAFNETLAIRNFTVGLTDRAEYVRRYLEKGIETNGKVSIRASGYHENETVTVNITYHENKTAPGKPVKGYPKSVNASAGGVVTDSWRIPDNASLGIYMVALTNATSVKPKVDIQNFTVIEITVYCQPQNRYDPHPSPLPDVSIGVYDKEGYVGSGISNRTGWVNFLLDRGNYTFRAFWKRVPVGSLNGSTTGTTTGYFLQMKFYIKCELVHIKMVVSDESVPPRRLPFINVTLISNRTTDSFETNYTGTVSTNTFTNITYRIEARRYGHLFFNQSIGNLTSTPPQINITCPTYTLFIHASDSKERPIRNATVEVIEWSSGRIAGLGKTSEWGSVRLDCTFGRYKVRVYNAGQTIILNETVVEMTRNQFYLMLHCRTVNLDLSVKVVDYFGQPIPNAVVKIERENLEVLNLTTGPDGIASKNKLLGGDYRAPARISLYVAGRLQGVKSLYLDESREIIFQVGDYVMVGGYPVESNQLVTAISLTILVVFCALTLIYRRRSKKS